jgi:excisionase family DNA binding protein
MIETETQVVESQFHSLRELAAALGLHYMTVLGWARSGKIHTVRNRFERKYRIPHDEWIRLMALPLEKETADGPADGLTSEPSGTAA